MKKCPFCAEEIQVEAIKCKHCGEFLGPSQKCRECGAEIPGRADFCPNCSVLVMPTTTPILTPTTTKNKTVAALLALFLGWIGIHKFYLGESGKGVLYMLFCWTLIPAIISFITALKLFGMSEKEFACEYRDR